MSEPMKAHRSSSNPLGSTCIDSGVNFSVLSVHATAMQLFLFHRVEDARASRVIDLSPARDLTAQYWHVFLPGIGRGSFTDFAHQGRMILLRGTGSIPRNCCSIPMLKALR